MTTWSESIKSILDKCDLGIKLDIAVCLTPESAELLTQLMKRMATRLDELGEPAEWEE